jgi:hypothetical protein
MKHRGRSGVGRSHGHFESLGGGKGEVRETVRSSRDQSKYSQCAGVSRVRIAGMM